MEPTDTGVPTGIIRRGVKTTEFWTYVGTVGVTWLTTMLVVLDQIAPNVPVEWEAGLTITTMIVTALLQAAYSLSRSKVKSAIGLGVGPNVPITVPEGAVMPAKTGDVTVAGDLTVGDGETV